MKDKKEELIKKYEQVHKKINSLEKEQRDIGEEYIIINREIIKEKKLLSKLHWTYNSLKGNANIWAKEKWDTKANKNVKELYKLTEYLSFDHFVPFYFESIDWEEGQSKHTPVLNFNDDDIYISMETCSIDKRDPLTVLFSFCKEWDIEVDFSPLEKIIGEKKKEYEVIEEILEKIKK